MGTGVAGHPRPHLCVQNTDRLGIALPVLGPSSGLKRSCRHASRIRLLLEQDETDTVVCWHRKGFRLDWRSISKRGPGRPRISAEVQELIPRFAAENAWGARKIHAELEKLGFTVGLATVSRTGPARPRTTLMARTSTGDTQSQQATKPAAPRTSERPGCSPADAIRNGPIEARRTRLARVYCGSPPPPSTSQGSVS